MKSSLTQSRRSSISRGRSFSPHLWLQNRALLFQGSVCPGRHDRSDCCWRTQKRNPLWNGTLAVPLKTFHCRPDLGRPAVIFQKGLPCCNLVYCQAIYLMQWAAVKTQLESIRVPPQVWAQTPFLLYWREIWKDKRGVAPLQASGCCDQVHPALLCWLALSAASSQKRNTWSLLG